MQSKRPIINTISQQLHILLICLFITRAYELDHLLQIVHHFLLSVNCTLLTSLIVQIKCVVLLSFVCVGSGPDHLPGSARVDLLRLFPILLLSSDLVLINLPI
jgi:hypothetical protein